MRPDRETIYLHEGDDVAIAIQFRERMSKSSWEKMKLRDPSKKTRFLKITVSRLKSRKWAARPT